MEKIPMTAAGYSTLEAELKHCQQVERPRIIQQITEARTHGDLSENAEYHAAKEQQSINEGRIAELEDKLARADVIDVSKLSGESIKFGATVTLVDEDTDEKKVWQIVGEPEAVFVEKSLLGQNQRVLERPAEAQPRFPERLDFAKKTKRPGRSNFFDKRIVRPSIVVGLTADQRMGVIDGIGDARLGGRTDGDALVPFDHFDGPHNLQIAPAPALRDNPSLQHEAHKGLRAPVQSRKLRRVYLHQ